MIGKTLSHYRITDKLGQGGIGEVYRAEDTTLSRQVAIKVLPDVFAGDPERLNLDTGSKACAGHLSARGPAELPWPFPPTADL